MDVCVCVTGAGYEHTCLHLLGVSTNLLLGGWVQVCTFDPASTHWCSHTHTAHWVLPVTLPWGGPLGPPVPALQGLVLLNLWVPLACSLHSGSWGWTISGWRMCCQQGRGVP